MADHQCLLTWVQRDPGRTLCSARHQAPEGHFGIEWFNGSEVFKYPATAQPHFDSRLAGASKIKDCPRLQ